MTRRGKPVAAVIAFRELERLRGTRLHFADAYQKFVEAHALEQIGIEPGFARSVRDRSRGRKVSL